MYFFPILFSIRAKTAFVSLLGGAGMEVLCGGGAKWGAAKYTHVLNNRG